MVKLRGVNVFPEAIGATVVADARSNGEYFCFVDRVGEAEVDQMEVWVEVLDRRRSRGVAARISSAG